MDRSSMDAVKRIEIDGVIHYKPKTVEEHVAFKYNGFNPSTVTLPKGHTKVSGRRALPCDLVYERDSAVRLRDGITIYTDVFRTPGEGMKFPAIIGYSPYGKSGTGPQNYERMGPFACGIPFDSLSGYQKFEALDPAEWCLRGYCIINPDARGTAMSEGITPYWGQQEAEDVYDLIDWIVKQPWSNGKVAMAGNSWVAMSQVNHASRCPHPNLTCIAPWESVTDCYRDNYVRGGMPWLPGFHKMVQGGMCGPNYVEDMMSMAYRHVFFDKYWESKVMPISNISIPMYVLASYSTLVHTQGSFRTFRDAMTPNKWLRVHVAQEWSDLYDHKSADDLQRFFDYHMKGTANGWLSTPTEYPLAQQKNKIYYLNAAVGKLQGSPEAKTSVAEYEGHHLTSCTEFQLKFNNYTEIAGYPKIKLWLSCPDHDDMDVVVQLRKMDQDGNLLVHVNYPIPVPESECPDVNVAKYIGPQGTLRTSHICTYNPSKSTVNEPFYDHDRREPVPSGTIVAAEIGIWPIGMVFEAGESLLVRISGHDMAFPEAEMARVHVPEDANVGRHFVHTGGKFDSHLVLPVIS